jgi:dihydrofolate synthase/folylpolyglutamate synthase
MTDLSCHQVSKQGTWSLDQWLSYVESIHPLNIELGLDRVNQVFARLQLDFTHSKIVTVAGTNGKGTTCTMLEQAALLAGNRVAVYCSPHLLDYKERVRINGELLTNAQHCAAFARVEQARAEVSLTYFEFGTLAAMVLIAEANTDISLLEVGLGGRLDAVNILDPHIAVITSIDLDHQAWLGDSRELIAIEKAGIFRESAVAVIGESNPPTSLLKRARELNLQAYWQGKEFTYQANTSDWCWQSAKRILDKLPLPQIPMQNASTALKVMELLEFKLSDGQLAQLLKQTAMAGRGQIIQSKPWIMLDVAHNPEATRYLAKKIAAMQYNKLHLVAGMLADKDIEQSLSPMLQLDADWYVGSLHVPRGAKSMALKSVLAGQKKVLDFDSVSQAYAKALDSAEDDDLIVVFGSFFSVAQVMQVTQ